MLGGCYVYCCFVYKPMHMEGDKILLTGKLCSILYVVSET